MKQHNYVVLGAGVVGLTTALELKRRAPTASVIIAAKHFPGDQSPEYCSPWAGANWMTTAVDGGKHEAWGAETYRRFGELADNVPETGITRMSLRAIFDRPAEEAGILSRGTGKIWYEELTGGIEYLPKAEVNTECLKAKVEMRRAGFGDIRDLFRDIPARAYFNCTGLGSCSLKGVEDKQLFPTRGQVMLVETPKTPFKQMYFRSPRRVDNDTTYVFPRYPTGGVVLGGCRLDNDWNTEPDLLLAEDIKRRCCDLAPELGNPQDLKVLYHAVGLRPGRKGGIRVEPEKIDGCLVIHNYGAGGTGYQSSWGTAKHAVDLLERSLREEI
ncbi:FAD dependent oxidoreductase [Aspergillus ellipticus CBS 707.79]|uniref:FAD dependent oxidoreductase n=1 Tax=Aspergillus ellipticus CBS 707.79 TaxID=1448320 RepID=A0A319ETT2_9EURO|nr:FAD dependent oxidoreductase [Aspergillus ellipticus CBS 707.79]